MPKKKADISKYAAENGIKSAVRHFSKDFPGVTLEETMVHNWKVKYLSELEKRKHEGGELVVDMLPVAKMGWPLLLGEDLDKKKSSGLFVFAKRRLGSYQHSNSLSCSGRHGENEGSQVIGNQ